MKFLAGIICLLAMWILIAEIIDYVPHWLQV